MPECKGLPYQALWHMRVRPQRKKRSAYGHILIYKCHKFTQAFPFLHKGPSWQPVLSLKYRMSTGAAGVRQTEHRDGDNYQHMQRKHIRSAEIPVVES